MNTIQQLKEELEKWKEQCEEAEKRKSNTLLDKLEADDQQKDKQQILNQLLQKSTEIEDALSEKQSLYQSEIQDLKNKNEELRRNVEKLDYKMTECRKTFDKARNDLQVDNKLPQKNINFTEKASGPGNLSSISYTCQILIHHPYILQERQALLTFEKEEVAQGIIRNGRHNVDFNNVYEEVRACKVQLGRTMTFEVNMTISNTKVNVGNLPMNLPEETLKDKLELTFYKSNIGGSEIMAVDSDRSKNTACITYKENGVAQRVLKTPQHLVKVHGSMYEIMISPLIEIQLKKLQIFSGICQRTVLLEEIRNRAETEEDIKDLVEIHFQKPSNGGGEVENIAFSPKKQFVYFEEDKA
ncbi:N-myc-interactor [Bufo bufo]|uniref:N-myc-interactor n=1 Tax=Bufo bufo TaxID=8384 RepID=UPI001ABE1BF8|nr:N-myc-interactor [Bufo bufo]XP_040297305.1 N-myc-interactor [Bufo bufo]